MWRIIALCIMITSLTADNMVSYKNYKVYSIVPTTQSQWKLLQTLKNINKFSYWQEPSWIGREVLIMVPPHKQQIFIETMKKVNMIYRLKINNVQKLIDYTMSQNQSRGFDFKSYHTVDKIYNNLDELAEKYPYKVKTVVAGQSYFGLQIKGVEIMSGKEKPGIFIEGGIHAREWISPAIVMYILHQLLTSQDPNVRYVADNHNWFIFPIFNPDGYAYTFNEDRLWKKTLKPSSFVCLGSDLNRNWDFRWGAIGINNNPCSDIYPGYEPFSEVETGNIVKYIESIFDNFYGYVSFHGFGQKLMFPYSYMDSNIPYKELYRIGSKAINALKKRYQTKYEIGCTNELQGFISGLSVDYVAHVLKKPVVYLYKLRDKGQYGFLLPPDQIIPTGEETLDSLIVIFNETLLRKYAKNN